MSLFFTSDCHFYHKNIIQYTTRPFVSIEEMNETLINNWNDKVKNRKDEIYILGDFAFAKGLIVNDLLKKLNGKKYLIIGNHDRFLKDKELNTSLFEWIKDYYSLRYNKMNIVLFHYPMETWERKHYGSICLHGHVHNSKINEVQNRFNVGVDVNNFTPVSLKEILERNELICQD